MILQITMLLLNILIDNKYYDFKDAKTPSATVSALLGDFIRNGDSRIKRIKESGAYFYYLAKNESSISIEKLSGDSELKKDKKNPSKKLMKKEVFINCLAAI